MLRVKFEKQLQELDNLITQMGYLCIVAIDKMTQALVNLDKELGQELIDSAGEIDQLENEIQSLCMKLLIQQQPVARDFRKISAALKIITDMERIGDQASDIAEILQHSNGQQFEEIEMLVEMALEAKSMLQNSVRSYVEQDTDLAKEVILADDVVDKLFGEVGQSFVQRVKNGQANDGVALLDVLMIAKYLERIADHATNISEWVEYSITG